MPRNPFWRPKGRLRCMCQEQELQGEGHISAHGSGAEGGSEPLPRTGATQNMEFTHKQQRGATLEGCPQCCQETLCVCSSQHSRGSSSVPHTQTQECVCLERQGQVSFPGLGEDGMLSHTEQREKKRNSKCDQLRPHVKMRKETTHQQKKVSSFYTFPHSEHFAPGFCWQRNSG